MNNRYGEIIMSLFNKALKLAQELDNKGLLAEADVLDKFASDLPSSKEAQGFEWMTPDVYMEMFAELFEYKTQEEGMDSAAAASAAVRDVNELAQNIEESPDPTDEEREQARELAAQQLDLMMLDEAKPSGLLN
jgi:hypothetical protein